MIQYTSESISTLIRKTRKAEFDVNMATDSDVTSARMTATRAKVQIRVAKQTWLVVRDIGTFKIVTNGTRSIYFERVGTVVWQGYLLPEKSIMEVRLSVPLDIVFDVLTNFPVHVTKCMVLCASRHECLAHYWPDTSLQGTSPNNFHSTGDLKTAHSNRWTRKWLQHQPILENWCQHTSSLRCSRYLAYQGPQRATGDVAWRPWKNQYSDPYSQVILSRYQTRSVCTILHHSKALEVEKEQIDKIMKMKFIEPTQTEWALPVVFVSKKNGSLWHYVKFW